jgi:tetratricopeptide (TPR) repeat protein
MSHVVPLCAPRPSHDVTTSVARRIWRWSLLTIAALTLSTPASNGATNALLIEMEGRVVVSRSGSVAWDPAYTNQALFPGDRLRTMERSRAVVRLSDLSLLRLSELSHIQIPDTTTRRGGFHLLRGLIYFFHRDKPGVMPVTTPTAYAVVLGTEFTVEVTEDGSTRLTLFEGTIDVTNQFGRVALKGGEGAHAGPASAPARTPHLQGLQPIQWVLYYPGILDPEEIANIDQPALRESLQAYRAGDLHAALANYPAAREPASEIERVYLAGVLLAVGHVDQAQALINGDKPQDAATLAGALRRVIAAVHLREEPPAATPQGASAWLAESYYQQSRSDLARALDSARRATELSSNFGFAWARRAELEFSFGRISAARSAIRRSMELAPRNAQAFALQGFLFAAENKVDAAISAFNQAITLDGALGNAWLGRGLCRIRQGDLDVGREDLQVAVTLEPQRAVLRSYLGKAFATLADTSQAAHELLLAMTIDPNDPTAWLYSALLNQQRNRINDGVRDLERSQELNDRRSVYRSRELLDQDRAVRGANLAGLYRDAGMHEVGVHEAGRAVASDYANYSAHLFLANSYNELRDPNLVNLRYETPTFSEYLIANLLSPVGGTMLSPRVSQQEYSPLFEQNRFGLSSAASYATDGNWMASGSQFGVVDNIGYALDATWRSRNGERRNDDLEQFVGSGQFKVQATPQDSFYFLGAYGHVESGDVRPLLDQAQASPTLRVKEVQEPNLFAGYHREWSPGVHTLFLGARLDDTLRLREQHAFVPTLIRDSTGTLTGQVSPAFSTFDVDYRSSFNAWSAELQQIVQRSAHTVIAGVRYQIGEAQTESVLDRDPFAFPPVFADPASSQDVDADLERSSAYAYYHLRVIDPLLLIGGVAYDHLRYPKNADLPPIRGDENTREQVSPKAGLVWTPLDSTSLRAVYARSLGGVFYDSSVRLEPTQVAGFTQSYRSLIPESIVGPVPGSRFETINLGLEHKFPTHTYLILETEWLRSEGKRSVGVFDFTDAPPFVAVPSSTPQELNFDERSLALSIHQLVGSEWAFGTRYRLSRAELESEFTELPTALIPEARGEDQATLHQLNLFAIWQNAAGFFARGEGIWYAQNNENSTGALPDDAFWHCNAVAGYRFPRRRAEIAVGLLNITDQDYRLNPLNSAIELPRGRTFMVSMRFNL